jgi:AcrR family transcriptional regulator
MELWFHLYYPELTFRLSRPKVPAMRADAERNKKLIVQAAREVFATAGLAAPIDEIAQRAGVGTGTLYRHFPTKEALFEAVVIGRVEDLVEEARRLIAGNDPKTAFFKLFSKLVQHGDGHKDLMDALGKQSFDIQKAVPGLLAEMWTGVGQLLEQAQQVGTVRRDVQLSHVQALVSAVCTADLQGGGLGFDRVVWTVISDGLRPKAGKASRRPEHGPGRTKSRTRAGAPAGNRTRT